MTPLHKHEDKLRLPAWLREPDNPTRAIASIVSYDEATELPIKSDRRIKVTHLERDVSEGRHLSEISRCRGPEGWEAHTRPSLGA